MNPLDPWAAVCCGGGLVLAQGALLIWCARQQRRWLRSTFRARASAHGARRAALGYAAGIGVDPLEGLRQDFGGQLLRLAEECNAGFAQYDKHIRTLAQTVAAVSLQQAQASRGGELPPFSLHDEPPGPRAPRRKED